MDDIAEKKEEKIASVSEFESKSITSLFWKYSLFALAGMLVQMVGTVADGFFVGNGIGPVGMGGHINYCSVLDGIGWPFSLCLASEGQF